MRSEFSTDKFIWNQLLMECNYDFYHLPSYLDIEQDLIGGDSVFFYYENGLSKALIPFIKRKIDSSSYYDLVSPYGYAGILINENFNHRDFNKVINNLEKSSMENNIVSAFIRLNPILNNFLFEESEQKKQEIHGRTVFVSLQKPYEELFSHYSSNHKRNIKKLRKEGYFIKKNEWDEYENWQRIYHDTMERLKASKYYYFDSVYFKKLKQELKNNLIFLSVHDRNGILAAGGLFTSFNGVIQYHLGGTNHDYLPFAPTKLMFDEIIKYGHESQCEILHLGGGLGSEADSLFLFKSGFSKDTYRFSTLRLITNKPIYDQLVQERSQILALKDIKDQSFFPLYRFEM